MQRFRGSKCLIQNALRQKESAGKELTTTAPTVRVVERIGTEAPAAATPAAADSPQNAIDIADITNVGVSVRQKRSLLTIRLLRKYCEELSESDFDLRFTTKSGDDGGIEGVFEQLVDDELFGGDLISLVLLQEVGLEVVTEVADLHPCFFRSVDDEVLAGGEASQAGNLDCGREAFKEFLRYRFRKHQTIAEEFQSPFLTAQLLDDGVDLADGQILHCKHDVLLALNCALVASYPRWDC